MRLLFKRAILLFPLITASSPGNVFAAGISWTGGADNNWYSAANWTPGRIPTSADSVVIDADATVVVNAGSPSIAFASLTLGDAGGAKAPTLKISNPLTTAGSLFVDARATLTQDSSLQWALGAVTVAPGGLITHSANSNARSFIVNLNVAGDFDLQAGASIAVDGLGYAGGQGSGYSVVSNAGFGPGGGGGSTLTGVNVGGGGGGHGGSGGSSIGQGAGLGGAANDSLTNPADLGSGGGGGEGACSGPAGAGGAGGGAVVLAIGGALNLNGTISANGSAGFGQSCVNSGGGGAGGTVNISAGTLTGGGSIAANGGTEPLPLSAQSGGGGGGRIAIAVAGADNSHLSLHAAAGTVNGSTAGGAGAGTIALRTQGGPDYSLAIGAAGIVPQSTTPVSGQALSFSTVSLLTSLVVFDPGSTVSINALVVSGAATVTAANLIFGSGGIDVKSGGTLMLNARSSSGGPLLIERGGTFVQGNAANLDLPPFFSPGYLLVLPSNHAVA